MAEAALAIIQTDDLSYSGQTLIDEAVLRSQGVTDFDVYLYDSASKELMRDLYLDD